MQCSVDMQNHITGAAGSENSHCLSSAKVAAAGSDVSHCSSSAQVAAAKQMSHTISASPQLHVHACRQSKLPRCASAPLHRGIHFRLQQRRADPEPLSLTPAGVQLYTGAWDASTLLNFLRTKCTRVARLGRIYTADILASQFAAADTKHQRLKVLEGMKHLRWQFEGAQDHELEQAYFRYYIDIMEVC